MKRSGFKNRGKGLQRQDPQVAIGKQRWVATAQSGPCDVCGYTPPPGLEWMIQGHHILPLSQLKRMNLDPAHWHDLRNQLRVCSEPAPRRCHERHTNHVVRISREVVLSRRPEVLAFAAEHDLEWLLDREYPVTPADPTEPCVEPMSAERCAPRASHSNTGRADTVRNDSEATRR